MDDTMPELLFMEPTVLRHFALDPLASSNFMARVTPMGLNLYPNTYFLTGDSFIIPAKGGKSVAILCHAPLDQHSIEPDNCALLKYFNDPWYVSTALVFTNNDPYLSVIVPKYCDVYALIKHLCVELVVCEDQDFFQFCNL